MALTTEDKQRISRILSTALSYFTEIAVYADSWHNDFKVERLNEIYAELRLALRGLHLDLHDMTKEDLMFLWDIGTKLSILKRNFNTLTEFLNGLLLYFHNRNSGAYDLYLYRIFFHQT